MRKNFFTLLIISMLTSSILIGCNSEKVETPTNEIENINNETTRPTPTEYIDYNNNLEVGGVSGMGVSSVTIMPENSHYADDYKGMMNYNYEPLNNAMISSTNYVYMGNENESYIETNVEFANKNKYSFSWISDTSMGTSRETSKDGNAIYLYNKEKTSRFSTWNGSFISEEEFSKYNNMDLKNKIKISDENANLEDCWKQDNNEQEISLIYAIDYKENDKEYMGFRKIIINKQFEKFVQFEFVQLKDNYNRENAYKTISSITLKNENDKLIDKITTIETITN